MSTIVTRSGKGSPLTNTEVDANFTNLNTDKAELSGATFTGAITANAGVVVDNITIDGNEIDVGSGNFVLDVAGEIELDADGGKWIFLDGGTQVGRIENSSSDFVIKSSVNDKDIKFNGEDGGSNITALTLDMSAAGAATFNGTIAGTRISLSDGVNDAGSAGSETVFNNDGTTANFRVESTGNANMLFIDGGTNYVGIGSATNYAAKLAVEGGKTVSNGIPYYQLSVVDDSSLATGNGGAINFWGKYTSAGDKVEGASIEAYKANSTSANYQYGMSFKTRTHGSTNIERLWLDQTGAVFNDTGIDADFRIESSGNANMLFVDGGLNKVGIGVVPVQGTLTIKSGGNTYATSALVLEDTDSTTRSYITHVNGDLAISNNGSTDQLVINAAGAATFSSKVGIGTAPSHPLTVSAADGTLAVFTNASDADFVFKTASGVALITPSTGTLALGTSNTERMRIDSSGNLYCSGGSGGTVLTLTASSGTTSGDIGRIRFGNNNIDSNLVNIVGYQDGATNSGGLKFETQPTGGATVERMRIDSSGNVLIKTGALQLSDVAQSVDFIQSGAINFDSNADQTGRVLTIGSNRANGASGGTTNAVFYEDGTTYLSGGVYLGGTGAANKLDDYEEGTWTPVDDSGAALTFTTPTGKYTKIGNKVYVSCHITYPTTSSTANIKIGGLPFGVGSSQGDRAGLSVSYTTYTTPITALGATNTTYFELFTFEGARRTNADLSAKVIYIGGFYEIE